MFENCGSSFAAKHFVDIKLGAKGGNYDISMSEHLQILW